VAAGGRSTYRLGVTDAETLRAAAPVPFLDLSASHAPLADAILADVRDLLNTGAFTNGPQVGEFERAFAAYCGVGEAVGVASGLDALRLALIASGIEPGDEVIVPAQTFVATFEAVTQAGGRPVVADVRPDDYCLDPDAVADAIGPQTRFLLPVHLYGQMADMRRLAEIAQRHALTIISDAAQAHGASRDGVAAGGNAIAAAFSFYPGKNLGALGDAGALTTDDSELASRVRALREHGQTAKYQHEYEGWTSRLDTIQAIGLLHKLPHLDRWNEERRKASSSYSTALQGVGDLVLPDTVEGSHPVWHLYVVRTSQPAVLAEFLCERGISSGRHYPEPPHLSAAYAQLGYRPGSFPVAEAISNECLSLPIFPGITEAQIQRVSHAVAEFFDG
jgi:dTDP-3-amino-3,4,6-trideoxy-alpha-D-glucose transaminase